MENDPFIRNVAPESSEYESEEEDLLAGMRELIETYHQENKTVSQELQELYEKGGNTEQGKKTFDKYLDKVASEILMTEGTEFSDNLESIKKMRKIGSNEEDIAPFVARQNEILSETKEYILDFSDIPTEASLSQLDAGKLAIQQKIEAYSGEEDSAEGILKILGILRQGDGDDEPKFVYPRELFPDSTNKKWDNYLDSVALHLQSVGELESGSGDKGAVTSADSLRRNRHNSVAKDVHKLLGYDNLKGEDWDFENTRNLLAKMRDERFPTVESSEAAVTARLTAEGLKRALRAQASSKVLSSKAKEYK